MKRLFPFLLLLTACASPTTKASEPEKTANRLSPEEQIESCWDSRYSPPWQVFRDIPSGDGYALALASSKNSEGGPRPSNVAFLVFKVSKHGLCQSLPYILPNALASVMPLDNAVLLKKAYWKSEIASFGGLETFKQEFEAASDVNDQHIVTYPEDVIALQSLGVEAKQTQAGPRYRKSSAELKADQIVEQQRKQAEEYQRQQQRQQQQQP